MTLPSKGWEDGRIPHRIKVVDFDKLGKESYVPILVDQILREMKRCLDVYRLHQHHCPEVKLSKRSKMNYGQCIYRGKKIRRVVRITINRKHIEREKWYEVLNTVTHEMAHVICISLYNASNHGPLFQKVHNHLLNTRNL